MNNYWLSRGGGAPEGPYEESQVIAMWALGQIIASDPICVDGSEDWRPAGFVLQHVDAAMKAAQSPSGPLVADVPALPVEISWAQHVKHDENGCLCIGLCVLGVLGLFFFIIPGLLFFILAAMLNKVHWTCSNCGNRVERSSSFCPSCTAKFGYPKKEWKCHPWTTRDTWLLVAVLSAIATIVLLAWPYLVSMARRY